MPSLKPARSPQRAEGRAHEAKLSLLDLQDLVWGLRHAVGEPCVYCQGQRAASLLIQATSANSRLPVGLLKRPLPQRHQLPSQPPRDILTEGAVIKCYSPRGPRASQNIKMATDSRKENGAKRGKTYQRLRTHASTGKNPGL